MIRHSLILERLFNIRLQLDSADSLFSSMAGHCMVLAREVLEDGTTRLAYEHLLNLMRRVGCTEAAIKELVREVEFVNDKAFISKEEDQ
jgi:hypothetical protein